MTATKSPAADLDPAETMVADLQRSTGGPLRFEHWSGTFHVPSDVDLFVNATSIGLYPNVDAIPAVDLSNVRKDMLVADAVFNPAETRLLRAARDLNLPALDGLSMLVYQGVIGFEIWTGMKAPEGVMKQALQNALGARVTD